MKHSKIKLISWTLVTMALGLAFACFVWNQTSSQIINENTAEANVVTDNLGAVIESLPGKELIPKFFYFFRDTNQKPKLSADAYLVGDLNTGEIILSKNEGKKVPIASVSKLMTALVATEIAPPGEVAKVSRRALTTYGQNGNLRLGENIKISDLIHPLLMESSNRAAEVIAEHFDRENFLSKMNKEANILHMSNTSFKDPSGLSAENQSTVSDLFRLAGYIKQKHPELFDITKTRSYSNKVHTWYNISQFLRTPGYLGGKSGYTNPAGQTGISMFSVPLSKTDSRPIAIILLRSKDRYNDVQNVLKYLNKNVYYGGDNQAYSDWVKEKLNLPSIREPDYITFTFGGDIMLDRGVRSSVVKNFGSDYSKLFEKLPNLEKSDIVFANLEGPASDKGADRRNLYSFRMDPSVIPALKGGGVNIVSVANNHVGDWGLPAYIDTLARLRENEILFTGGGDTRAQAEQPTIIEKYGMKIGFLGFSDVGPDFMAAGLDKTGILLAKDPRFEEIISNASKQVDYLIVSFHWGDEYKKIHNARQEELAHKAIDSGAKIVIGHHPHVMQDSETYIPASCTIPSSCGGFIAYSLGNFIFDQKFSTDTMEGMLLNMKIWRDGAVSIQKNIVKLNSVFQPDRVIMGKEERVKFVTP